MSTAAAAAGKRGFPHEYKSLCPRDRRAWLAGERCRSLIEAGELQAGQVDAQKRRLDKERRRIAQIVPSVALLDAHQCGETFPPHADDPRSTMRRASRVLADGESQTLWPAAYLSDQGATYDVICRQTDQRAALMGLSVSKGARRSDDDGPSDGVSRHVALLERMAAADARLAELPLLTEEPAVLERQIARFLARRKDSRHEYEVRQTAAAACRAQLAPAPAVAVCPPPSAAA